MKQDTKTQIMDTAQRLTALKGFDAFSYRDVAEEVDIKTSSIHYYFPTKSDLAIALVDRYTSSLSGLLDEVSNSGKNGFEQIKALFGMICSVSGTERNFCLCGMLSADIHSVADESKSKINHFFTLLDNWVENALKAGVKDGSVHSSIRPKSAAAEITATIEGAMLIARVKDKENYLQDTLDIVLARLRA